MAKATSAPLCRNCGTHHWAREPHDKAGIAAARKPPKASAPPQKKHTQGRGPR